MEYIFLDSISSTQDYIKENIDNGNILKSRYENYLKFIGKR